MPEITMPKLSDTMTEGTLLRWLKKKGDQVEVGDIIAEVETDKATMEMEAFEEGSLPIFLCRKEEKFSSEPQSPSFLPRVKRPGSDPQGARLGFSRRSFCCRSGVSVTARVSSGRPLTPRARAAALRGGAGGGNLNAGVRVKASPLARKIADARGVRLDSLKGTGPGGRIIAFDVENAPVGGISPAPAAGSSPIATILPTPIAGMPETKVPLSGMRRVIAERLLASKTQIPHFYLQHRNQRRPDDGLSQGVQRGGSSRQDHLQRHRPCRCGPGRHGEAQAECRLRR